LGKICGKYFSEIEVRRNMKPDSPGRERITGMARKDNGERFLGKTTDG